MIPVKNSIQQKILWVNTDAENCYFKLNIIEGLITSALIAGITITTIINHGCHTNPHKDEELRLTGHGYEKSNENTQQVMQGVLEN